MRAWLLSLGVGMTFAVASACGPKQQVYDPSAAASSSVPPAPSESAPACTQGPANPAEVLAKEPAVLQACIASSGKIDANLCGSAKIAVEVGKDGRVVRAEVAQSTLPVGVTDCIKARLAAVTYACPAEGTATYTVPVGLPIGGPTGACPGLPAPPPAGP
ncbi:MAG: hypothetical protein ACXWUG_31470 [Polyangiales bacterium]